MKFFEHETGGNTAGYHLESSNIAKRVTNLSSIFS